MTSLIEDYFNVLDLRRIIDQARKYEQFGEITRVRFQFKNNGIDIYFFTREDNPFFVVYNQDKKYIQLGDKSINLNNELIGDSGISFLNLKEIFYKYEVIAGVSKYVSYTVDADYVNNNIFITGARLVPDERYFNDTEIFVYENRIDLESRHGMRFKVQNLDNNDIIVYNSYTKFCFSGLYLFVYKNREIKLEKLVNKKYRTILVVKIMNDKISIDYNNRVNEIEGEVRNIRDFRYLLKEYLPKIYKSFSEEFFDKLEYLESLPS